MLISLIDDFKQFDELKNDWNTVYSRDPEATIHRSWAWLKGWVESTSYKAIVLAIRPDNSSSYIAFMALGIKNNSTLFIGGYPTSAHTGFVCLPDYAEQAIPAFADFTQKQLQWDIFEMRDVLDPRLDLFLKCFCPGKFYVDRIADSPCPYIFLPDSWEGYLKEFLGYETRKTLRKAIRRIERNTELRETNIQSDNIQNNIEILLDLMQRRWGQKSEQFLKEWRTVMCRTFESNLLWLKILWHKSTPISALGAFADQEKKSFSAFIIGHNDDYAKLSPGKVIYALSIQYAIKNGFLLFDFGRGNSNYKFSTFGAKERFNENIIIERKTMRNRLRRLRNKIRSKIR